MTGRTIHKPEARPQPEEPKGHRTYFVALMLLVLGLLAHLWGVSKTMRQAEELDRLRIERQVLLGEQERLGAEISGLAQSSRIRDIAEKKLGMVFPKEEPLNLYLGKEKPVQRKAEN
jgi:cell division protein FtsL